MNDERTCRYKHNLNSIRCQDVLIFKNNSKPNHYNLRDLDFGEKRQLNKKVLNQAFSTPKKQLKSGSWLVRIEGAM